MSAVYEIAFLCLTMDNLSVSSICCKHAETPYSLFHAMRGGIRGLWGNESPREERFAGEEYSPH